MTKRILAVDPSLNSLGYAYDKSKDVAYTGTIANHSNKNKLIGMPRLEFHLASMRGLLDTVKPEFIVLEGYAMGARGNTFDIGELVGVLKFEFYTRKIQTLIVPPANLKLFATGKGNSKKEFVVETVQKRTGCVFSTDDEADAFVLLEMGKMFLQPRERPRDPAHYQNRALDGCKFM